jgi:hypothetical protein
MSGRRLLLVGSRCRVRDGPGAALIDDADELIA